MKIKTYLFFVLILGTILLSGCSTTKYYSNCNSCKSSWQSYTDRAIINFNATLNFSSNTANLTNYYNKTEDDLLDVRKIPILYDEFTYWTTARTEGIGICAALSSGTAAVIIPDDRRIGRISFLDSTTANGGYICRTDVAQLMYFTGNERLVVGFDLTTANVLNTTIIMGFGDSTTAAEPTDGCYLYSFNRKMQGRCKNNAGPSKTSTNLTLVTNGKYIAEISMNQDATSALFNVYNYTSCTNYRQIGIGIFSSCTLLWSNTVGANIPKTAARAFGLNMIAFQSSTSAAAILVNWDSVLLDR